MDQENETSVEAQLPKKRGRKASKEGEKFKVTIYLNEEAERAFAELYVKRYMVDRKIDRSTIACEAILAFHKSQCEKEGVEERSEVSDGMD